MTSQNLIGRLTPYVGLLKMIELNNKSTLIRFSFQCNLGKKEAWLTLLQVLS